jgi:hypothetical protein
MNVPSAIDPSVAATMLYSDVVALPETVESEPATEFTVRSNANKRKVQRVGCPLQFRPRSQESTNVVWKLLDNFPKDQASRTNSYTLH